jgi:hypothetical protein
LKIKNNTNNDEYSNGGKMLKGLKCVASSRRSLIVADEENHG